MEELAKEDEIVDATRIYVVAVDDGLHEQNIYCPCDDLSIKIGSRVYLDRADLSYEVLDARYINSDAENCILLDFNQTATKYPKPDLIKDEYGNFSIPKANPSSNIRSRYYSYSIGTYRADFDMSDPYEKKIYKKLKRYNTLKYLSIFLFVIAILDSAVFLRSINKPFYDIYLFVLYVGVPGVLGFIFVLTSNAKTKKYMFNYLKYSVEEVGGKIVEYNLKSNTLSFELNNHEYNIEKQHKENKIDKAIKTKHSDCAYGSLELKYNTRIKREFNSYFLNGFFKVLSVVTYLGATIYVVIYSFIMLNPIIMLLSAILVRNFFLKAAIHLFVIIGIFIIAKIFSNEAKFRDYYYAQYYVKKEGGTIIKANRDKGLLIYELNGETKKLYFFKSYVPNSKRYK